MGNKITNETLKKYVDLDREIKEKSKLLSVLKNDIVVFLEKRDGKSLITEEYIALFQSQKRTFYDIPDSVKKRYKKFRDLRILKVSRKRNDL